MSDRRRWHWRVPGGNVRARRAWGPDWPAATRGRWAKLPGLLGEVGHGGAGFEGRQRRAAAHRLVIDDCGHPAIRRNLQTCRRELIAATDIDRLDAVRQPQLFK